MHEPETYSNLVRPECRDADTFPVLAKSMGIQSGQRNGLKILDFGCGDGKLASMYLFPLVEKSESELVCLDISETMIEYAKTHYPHPRTRYVTADLMSPSRPFQEAEFDFIFSFYALHYIKDYRAAFQILHQHLKPGGMLGFVTVVKHREFLVHKYLANHPKWAKYTEGYENFLPDWIESAADPTVCIRNAVEGCGFSIREFQLLKKGSKYETMIGCAAFHRSIYPFTSGIPKDLHVDLERDILSLICETTNVPDQAETHKKAFTNEFEVILCVVQK